MMDSRILDALELPAEEGIAEQLVETVLQQIPSGVMVLDVPSNRVLYANKQMASAWGSENLCRSVTSGKWRGYHADGRKYSEGEWPHQRAAEGERITEPIEIEIDRADGTRGMASMTAIPLTDKNERIVAVLLTCLDVTEREQKFTAKRFLAEAEAVLASSSTDFLQTLRDLARLAVPTLADWCVIDLVSPDGELHRVSVEHADPAKQEAADTLASNFAPSALSRTGIAQVVQTGRPELIADVTDEYYEERAIDEDHRKVLQELGLRSAMLVPLIARGRVLGAISFAVGESGRKYDQTDLEVAQDLASRVAYSIVTMRLTSESQAASEAKSDFLAVMSHELRTPLTAIIGYAELLQLGVPEPVTQRQYEQAERIEVSARQLLQMIEEILTLVTLQSGEGRVRHRPVSVNEMGERVKSIIEPMARAKALTMELVEAEGDPEIETDPDKLLQILLNLLSNAVKFTEEGTIGLEIKMGEERVAFEVHDTGIGMEEGHFEQIFEPFWQAERPITRKVGGTGLGLTIAMRLTEMLGGTLEVDSRPGGGSRFCVSMPVKARQTN